MAADPSLTNPKPFFHRSVNFFKEVTNSHKIYQHLSPLPKKRNFSKSSSTNSKSSTALFWVVMQRVVVTSYRRFGTTSLSHLQGSGIQNKTRPIGCPETSLINHSYSLCNNPEELSSRLLRGGSLKSQKFKVPNNTLKNSFFQ